VGTTINWGPVEDRAIIARYHSVGETYAEVDMQRAPTFNAAFGHESPPEVREWPVDAILRGIRNRITQKVVPPLIRYLA
jgi:hypothetical protein